MNKLYHLLRLFFRVKELEQELNALRSEHEALKKQQQLGGSGSSVAAAKARQFSGELARRGNSTWKLAVVIIHMVALLIIFYIQTLTLYIYITFFRTPLEAEIFC